MELLDVVGKLVKEGKALEALEEVKKVAPEDVKRVADVMFKKPEEIKSLDGVWRAILTLIYLSYTSMYYVKRNDNRSLVNCVISSTYAVKICNELGIAEPVPMLLRNAARALTLMGMTDRAEKMYQEAERIAVNDPLEFAAVENDYATLLYGLKRYEEALDKIEEALRIRISLGSDEVLAETLVNAAEIYRKVGNYPMVDKCFREALTIYKNLIRERESFKFDLAITLSNFGLFCKGRHQYSRAEKLLKESLEIFEELEKVDKGFSQFTALTLRYIGDLYKEMGRFDDANEYYRKSKKKFVGSIPLGD